VRGLEFMGEVRIHDSRGSVTTQALARSAWGHGEACLVTCVYQQMPCTGHPRGARTWAATRSGREPKWWAPTRQMTWQPFWARCQGQVRARTSCAHLYKGTIVRAEQQGCPKLNAAFWLSRREVSTLKESGCSVFKIAMPSRTLKLQASLLRAPGYPTGSSLPSGV